jgi:hypothetical protein
MTGRLLAGVLTALGGLAAVHAAPALRQRYQVIVTERPVCGLNIRVPLTVHDTCA